MLTSVYKMYGQLIVNLSIKSALGGQEERRGNHCDGTTDIRLNKFVDISKCYPFIGVVPSSNLRLLFVTRSLISKATKSTG